MRRPICHAATVMFNCSKRNTSRDRLVAALLAVWLLCLQASAAAFDTSAGKLLSMTAQERMS